MDTPSFFKLVDSSEIALLDCNPATSWSFVWKAFLIVETFELDKEVGVVFVMGDMYVT